MFVALALLVGLASCVKDQKYPGISITNVTYTPIAVTEFTDVTVTATISSFYDFTADLVYTYTDENGLLLDGLEPVTVEMIPDAEKEGYSAVIPAMPNGTTVSFYIIAEGEMIAQSATMEYTVGAVAVDYSVLRLNELNGNDKFIEIYNAGTEAINMNGVTIFKDTDKLVWTSNSTVTINAGDYLVLWSEDVMADHQELDSIYFFHSGLSAKKNVRIQLFTPAGLSIDDFNLVNIDLNGEAYGYSGNQAPASYSRNADGNWYYADATPGAANVDGENIVLGLEGGVTPPEPPTPDEPDYTNLVLNELNGDTKFIEFYNKGNLDLTMEGMYLMKDDKTDPIWTADASIVIPAHGYVLLYSSDVLADHPELGENMFFNSGLSAKKSVRIALYMADGAERDVFTRESAAAPGEWGVTMQNVAPQSYARTPDGGDWKLADPTPGTANPAEGDPIPME